VFCTDDKVDCSKVSYNSGTDTAQPLEREEREMKNQKNEGLWAMVTKPV